MIDEQPHYVDDVMMNRQKNYKPITLRGKTGISWSTNIHGQKDPFRRLHIVVEKLQRIIGRFTMGKGKLIVHVESVEQKFGESLRNANIAFSKCLETREKNNTFKVIDSTLTG